MVADANVINGDVGTKDGGPTAAAPPAGQGLPPVQPLPPPARSMPKIPITRKHVDDAARRVVTVVAGLAKVAAGLARSGAYVIRKIWRAIDEIPSGLQRLFAAGLLMLSGIVGSIALAGTLGLVCAVVVVPVSSIAVGAFGHRWYGQNRERAGVPGAAADTSELERSVAYVDKKLTFALNSFGSERHQQAVIALFQAKTAVELALGTEEDTAGHIDEPVSVGDYGLRPRIQPGSRSALPESNSLAAS